jgi:hypothetical protein
MYDGAISVYSPKEIPWLELRALSEKEEEKMN